MGSHEIMIQCINCSILFERNTMYKIQFWEDCWIWLSHFQYLSLREKRPHLVYLFTSQNHDSWALDFSAFNVKLNSVLYTFPVVSTPPFPFRSIQYSVLLLINMNWEILKCWIGGGWILSRNVNRNRRIDCAHLLHTIIAYRVTSRRLQSPFHLLLMFRQTKGCQRISSTWFDRTNGGCDSPGTNDH